MPYKDPEARRHYSRKYHKANRAKILAKNKIYREGTKQQRRTRALHYQHRITDAAFDAMWITQKGRCAICAAALAVPPVRRGTTNAPCIDHDHVSGKIRDLLCMLCNRGLGNFKDSAETLSMAADYIIRHRRAVTIQQPNLVASSAHSMQGSWPTSEIAKATNPYAKGTSEWEAFQQGQQRATRDAQDGEE